MVPMVGIGRSYFSGVSLVAACQDLDWNEGHLHVGEKLVVEEDITRLPLPQILIVLTH
jgi:hypothetical protein